MADFCTVQVLFAVVADSMPLGNHAFDYFGRSIKVIAAQEKNRRYIVFLEYVQYSLGIAVFISCIERKI